jgi:hypothetical protein
MVTDKNHHCAKLSAPVLAQHEIPRKFSAHLQLGIYALHPKYCPLQATFAGTHLLQKNSVNILKCVLVQNILMWPSLLEFSHSSLSFALQKLCLYCEPVHSLVSIVKVALVV